MMSRIKTSYDNQTQQPNPKLLMLQSNINRIYSQNKKLQTVIQHTQTFQKMKDHVNIVHQNLSRLKQITNAINALDNELNTSREEMHNNINEVSNFINKNILIDIRKYKEKIKAYQNRIEEYKIKNKILIKKQITKHKQRFQEILSNNQKQSLKFIQNIQKTYNKKLQQNLLHDIAVQIIKQTKIIQNNCKTQAGHLQNLLFFFYDQKKYEKDQKIINYQIQNVIQLQQKILNRVIGIQKEINQFIETNCSRISQRVSDLQLKLKQILSQINYIKKKKKKTLDHKQIYSSLNSSKTQYKQSIALIQTQYIYSSLKNEVKGLQKYIQHALSSLNHQLTKLKQNKIQQVTFNQFVIQNKNKIKSLNNRLDQSELRIKQYQIFYKELQL